MRAKTTFQIMERIEVACCSSTHANHRLVEVANVSQVRAKSLDGVSLLPPGKYLRPWEGLEGDDS